MNYFPESSGNYCTTTQHHAIVLEEQLEAKLKTVGNYEFVKS